MNLVVTYFGNIGYINFTITYILEGGIWTIPPPSNSTWISYLEFYTLSTLNYMNINNYYIIFNTLMYSNNIGIMHVPQRCLADTQHTVRHKKYYNKLQSNVYYSRDEICTLPNVNFNFFFRVLYIYLISYCT